MQTSTRKSFIGPPASLLGHTRALSIDGPDRKGDVPAGNSAGWASASTEAELQWLLGELRARLSAGAQPRREPAPAFASFALEWLERQKLQGGWSGKGLTAKSSDDLQWRLSKHLLPVFGESPLDQITIERVDAYRLAKVREGNLGASTINKTIATLAAILDVALEYGLIERNPARGRRRRLAAPQPTRTRLERADQILALLDGAGELDQRADTRPGQRRVLLAVLLFAGLRIGEALALRWADVDLQRETILVRKAKTNAGIRTVNLLAVLQSELATYHARSAPSQDMLVFANDSGGAQSATNIRRRVLARAVALANEQSPLETLPEGLTPHSLRRTFASLLFALGESPPYVMGQMGHRTANLTLAIYAREMSRRDGEPERLRAITSRPLDVSMGERARHRGRRKGTRRGR